MKFVETQRGEQVESAVITVPASFDAQQCEATKKAGERAGLDHVTLLQEPIAASLAYANEQTEHEFEGGKWLVYDLGGGTFDVALMSAEAGELTVLDHEGDNYLGGRDFDDSIVQELYVPELSSTCKLENLEELTRASSPHNKLYHKLLLKAEEAKTQLSTHTSADPLVDVEDDDGVVHDVDLAITRSDFERIIRGPVNRTLDCVKTILAQNSLVSSDLEFILMVGGSTYIPYVRRQVEEAMGVPVVTDVDPTTAISVGASHYAGTREEFNSEPAKTAHLSDDSQGSEGLSG